MSATWVGALVLATALGRPESGAPIEPRQRALEQEQGFRVLFELPKLEGVSGRALAPDQCQQALGRLAAWSATYPRGFLRRWVREVVVVNDLVVDGVVARGHRRGQQVLLGFVGPGGAPLAKRDFDHEVFHALDGGLAGSEPAPDLVEEQQRVLRLRDRWDDYLITPSERYSRSWEAAAGKTPWIAYVPIVGLVWLATQGSRRLPEEPQGFANRWGTVAPREDRATVAELLLLGDEKFLRRAAGDRELREKVAIVKAMYRVGSAGAMDDAFWGAVAAGPSEVPSLVELERSLSATPEPRSRQREDPAPEPGPQAPPARPPILAVAEAPPRPVPPRSAPPSTRTIPAAAEPAPRPAATPTPAEPKVAPGPVAPPRVIEAPEAAPSSPAEAYGQGLAAFHARDWQRAGARWRTMLKLADPSYATIQIAINCKIENAIKNQRELEGRASYYMLPIKFQDAVCQISLTGLYRSREEGERAIALLPESIRSQRPRSLLVSEVLAEVRE